MSNAFNSILDSVKSLSPTPSEALLLYGTVMGVEPLSIKVNDRDTLPESFFVLSKFCILTRVTSELHKHGHPMGDTYDATVDTILWRGLEVGDKVVLLSFNQGQQYYVARNLNT